MIRKETSLRRQEKPVAIWLVSQYGHGVLAHEPPIPPRLLCRFAPRNDGKSGFDIRYVVWWGAQVELIASSMTRGMRQGRPLLLMQAMRVLPSVSSSPSLRRVSR